MKTITITLDALAQAIESCTCDSAAVMVAIIKAADWHPKKAAAVTPAEVYQKIYNAWSLLKAEDSKGAYVLLSGLVEWNPYSAKPISYAATPLTPRTKSA